MYTRKCLGRTQWAVLAPLHHFDLHYFYKKNSFRFEYLCSQPLEYENNFLYFLITLEKKKSDILP